MKILFMVESMMCWEEGKILFVHLWLAGYFMGNKQVFCAAKVLEKLWQSVDELYLFELMVD